MRRTIGRILPIRRIRSAESGLCVDPSTVTPRGARALTAAALLWRKTEIAEPLWRNGLRCYGLRMATSIVKIELGPDLRDDGGPQAHRRFRMVRALARPPDALD